MDWKKNRAGKRALLIQGARRIGKSTIVEEFAKNEYETYMLINFQSDLHRVEQLLKNDISDLDTFFRNPLHIVRINSWMNSRPNIRIRSEVLMSFTART